MIIRRLKKKAWEGSSLWIRGESENGELVGLGSGLIRRGMILSAERDPQEGTRRRWVMAQLLGLSAEQVARIRPLFPKKRDGKRVDDRKVLRNL